ncbi:MAG: dihydropteroate synthase [Acidobacteriales bacterium]|nr:dihydropteroate synthase [Terriglobales bacterium]
MGVVNVTPNSFSDGGKYLAPDRAVEYSLQLIAEGADIIDIGGESTRPGSAVPDLGEAATRQELERVLPVIAKVKNKQPNAVISIDTYKSEVARQAAAAGAEIVNDVSGFSWDPEMAKSLAALKCGAILMHTRGRPSQWSGLEPVSDIVMLVKRELRKLLDSALLAGVKRERLALDPGFGFGKRLEENYPLLKCFQDFHELRYPLVAGVSRKSFIGRALARNGEDASLPDRLYGTLAAETLAVMKGAHIIRTHAVAACTDAVRVADIMS